MSNGIIELSGYTIKRKLGTGARTTIYLARDDVSGKQIALKQAILETAEDQRIFEQIETEFKVSKDLDHPYIRKCFKIIKKRKMLKISELYMAMEFFDGKSLEDSKALSLVDVMLVFRMVAGGLNAMHTAGYIHCDIKPNNILILPTGHIKIIDLGQSCKMGTIKQRIQGTPDYIAPEQVRKEPLSHKTDIFNLGATMYWALTGKTVPTLIPQKSDFGMAAKPKEAKPPHEFTKRIPLGLSNLVMECVRSNTSQRPSNMNDVISRLDILIQSIMGSKLGQNVDNND